MWLVTGIFGIRAKTGQRTPCTQHALMQNSKLYGQDQLQVQFGLWGHHSPKSSREPVISIICESCQIYYY